MSYICVSLSWLNSASTQDFTFVWATDSTNHWAEVGGGAINPAASWRARRKVESCKQQEADRAKTSVGKESEKTE